MKWVKVAIGAVIAIAVVPMIALSVFNLTQEKVREEVVTFEVLTYDEVTLDGTVTSGTYSKILLYAELDVTNVTNTLSVLINEVEFLNVDNKLQIHLGSQEIYLYDGSLGDYDIIKHDDSLVAGVNLELNDIVKITFEVTTPPILNGVTATLLLLAPLIFVSGILYFIYNNKQEGI